MNEESKQSQWIWCLHCERCYQKHEAKHQCPYDDCHGDTLFDARNWSSIRRENPDYPAVPERGTIYPLYG